jgi:hypothetical protein
MLTTRLTFDSDADVPKLFFSNVEFLDSDTYDTIVEQGAAPAAVAAGKLNFKKRETAATAVPAMPRLVAPAGSAAAKIKAAESTDEPAPAPAPAAKAKAAPAPKKDSGLGTLVDEWGDD